MTKTLSRSSPPPKDKGVVAVDDRVVMAGLDFVIVEVIGTSHRPKIFKFGGLTILSHHVEGFVGYQASAGSSSSP